MPFLGRLQIGTLKIRNSLSLAPNQYDRTHPHSARRRQKHSHREMYSQELHHLRVMRLRHMGQRKWQFIIQGDRVIDSFSPDNTFSEFVTHMRCAMKSGLGGVNARTGADSPKPSSATQFGWLRKTYSELQTKFGRSPGSDLLPDRACVSSAWFHSFLIKHQIDGLPRERQRFVVVIFKALSRIPCPSDYSANTHRF